MEKKGIVRSRHDCKVIFTSFGNYILKNNNRIFLDISKSKDSPGKAVLTLHVFCWI